MAAAWSTTEIRVVRRLYPEGGVAACLPKLPLRSKVAIYGIVQLLGLRRVGAGAGRGRRRGKGLGT
jgi:hypothetical protein